MIAGELLGTRGPAKTFTPVNVWDLQLNAGRAIELSIPDGHTSLLIVQAGTVTANDTPVKSVELASFEPQGDSVDLRAETAARVLLLTGESMRDYIVGFAQLYVDDAQYHALMQLQRFSFTESSQYKAIKKADAQETRNEGVWKRVQPSNLLLVVQSISASVDHGYSDSCWD